MIKLLHTNALWVLADHRKSPSNESKDTRRFIQVIFVNHPENVAVKSFWSTKIMLSYLFLVCKSAYICWSILLHKERHVSLILRQFVQLPSSSHGVADGSKLLWHIFGIINLLVICQQLKTDSLAIEDKEVALLSRKLTFTFSSVLPSSWTG